MAISSGGASRAWSSAPSAVLRRRANPLSARANFLREAVLARGAPGPAAERVVEGAGVAEAREQRDLGEGGRGVAQVLQRELSAGLVEQAPERRPLVGQAALQA